MRRLSFTQVIALAMMISLSLFTLPSSAQAADLSDAVDRALTLLQSGEFDAARNVLNSVQPTDEQRPLALATTGIIEIHAGNFSLAEAAFRKTLTLDAHNIAALWGLSLCLLRQNRAFEATVMVDRAAIEAPNDLRIKALQGYDYLMLDRLTDAARASKAALDGGEKSPFLLATLAQIHRRMGYAQKALEFGSIAAKSFYGMDFLRQDPRINLPLTMIITDTPRALSADGGEKPKDTKAPALARTDLEIDIPKDTAPAQVQKIFEIAVPAAGSTVRGVQRVQAVYRGNKEVKFVVFLVDRIMRSMTTELPYHFDWDTEASAAGPHTLAVRAYDFRGVLLEEDEVAVTTVDGTPPAATQASVSERELESRMIGMTLPNPMPLSLYTHLGWWHRDVRETPQAIAAFEKAAAIDPSAEGVLTALQKLYEENGLHPISATGEVYRSPYKGAKRVALTFDDGPNPLYTPNVLNELKRYGVHSTFFLVGKMVQQYPDLVLQILADGHELANHSYTHPNLTKITQQELIAEVLRTRAVIKEVTGQQTYYFRPPGGNIDSFIVNQLRALDYNVIYWDVNAGEYKKFGPQEQVKQMLDKITDGSIVLMHNGPVDGTLNILPTLLDELNKRGFTCVTVSELMSPKK